MTTTQRFLNTRDDKATTHGHEAGFSARCPECREAWIAEATEQRLAIRTAWNRPEARAAAERAFDELFDTED